MNSLLLTMKYSQEHYKSFFSCPNVQEFMHYWLQALLVTSHSTDLLDEISYKNFDSRYYWKTLFFEEDASLVLSGYLDFIFENYYFMQNLDSVSNRNLDNVANNVGLLHVFGTIKSLLAVKIIKPIIIKDLSLLRTRDKIVHITTARILFSELVKDIYKLDNLMSLYKNSWRTSDLIWNIAGHNDLDFKFYSKRIILAHIYTSILRYSIHHLECQLEYFAYQKIDNIQKLIKYIKNK